MPSWPAELPQDAFVGLTDQRQDARLRSAMDTGPAKVRKRFTAAVRNLSTPLVLTGAQRRAFDAFWIGELGEGTLSFDWKDPVDDSAVMLRFTGDTPQFRAVAGHEDPDSRLWEATVSLEILP